uniref:Uncharacterized protein n=1 Tax=Rhizophora mucronata TaxID=61149 RepID=A0A2P2QMI4_RHIMU
MEFYILNTPHGQVLVGPSMWHNEIGLHKFCNDPRDSHTNLGHHIQKGIQFISISLSNL